MGASAAIPTSPSTKRGRVPARGPIIRNKKVLDYDSPAAKAIRIEEGWWGDTPQEVLESLFAIIDRNHSLHGECVCPEHKLIKRYREMAKNHTDIDRSEPVTAEEALPALTDDTGEVPELGTDAPIRHGRGKVENAEVATKFTDAKLRKVGDDLRFEVGKMVEVEAVCARLIELAQEEGNTESEELFQAVSDWATGNLKAYMRRAVSTRSY